jgi:hypothetical protein
MESWYGFFQTTAGASATLIGMLVVAISINLGRILSIAHLPGRAAGALVPLAGALVISILAFVPGQPPAVFGAEAGLTGAVIWVMTGLMLLRSKPQAGMPAGWLWSHLLLGQAQSLPFVIAGVLLILGLPGGLYWTVPGLAFAILGGIINTWVLLIEILR